MAPAHPCWPCRRGACPAGTRTKDLLASCRPWFTGSVPRNFPRHQALFELTFFPFCSSWRVMVFNVFSAVNNRVFCVMSGRRTAIFLNCKQTGYMLNVIVKRWLIKNSVYIFGKPERKWSEWNQTNPRRPAGQELQLQLVSTSEWKYVCPVILGAGGNPSEW